MSLTEWTEGYALRMAMLWTGLFLIASALRRSRR